MCAMSYQRDRIQRRCYLQHLVRKIWLALVSAQPNSTTRPSPTNPTTYFTLYDLTSKLSSTYAVSLDPPSTPISSILVLIPTVAHSVGKHHARRREEGEEITYL